MAIDTRDITAPLPFFEHPVSRRIFYIAAGPCPLVFAIGVEFVVRRAPVVTAESSTHPFGLTTAVLSLADPDVRAALAEARPFTVGTLEETLASWANFCDDVADRLNEGESLASALAETWLLRDAGDVMLDDLTLPPTRAP